MDEHNYTAGNIHKRVIWITRTSILTALLIVSQVATAPLGSTLITGALVNALLIISVLTCGLASGICVAVISPVLAKFFGIGPLWSLLPFIATGNIALVSLWFFITERTKKQISGLIISLIAASICKFLILYLGITKFAIPFLLDLPEKQANMISGMFAIPQFFTAFVGGVIALIVYSAIKIAIRGR